MSEGSQVNVIRFCLLLDLLSLAPLATAAEIKTLDLLTNDLVYCAQANRIYASIPAAAGKDFGNQIVAIDPASGAIVNSVFAGSEPGSLALTSDGGALYAGLNGAGSILRVELPELKPSLEFSLGLDGPGAIIAGDIAVNPWNPETIAVSVLRGVRGALGGGLVVYDHGIRRGALLAEPDLRRIEYGTWSDMLFGIGRQGELVTYSVMDDGVQRASEVRSIFRAGADIRFVMPRVTEGGQIVPAGIFSTDGAVVDPTAVRLLGTFAVDASGLDVNEDLVDFIQSAGSDQRIQTFHRTSFLPVSEVIVPGQGEGKSLIRTAEDAFAVVAGT
jgi:hypothetical protein